MLFYFSALTLSASLVLGGGTRTGFLSDVLLQVISIPALIIAFSQLPRSGAGRGLIFGVVFCCILALVPILQIVPLPPRLWNALPNRDEVVAAFALLNQNLAWRPASVEPSVTLLAALSLIPPIAIFIGVSQLNLGERRWMSLVVVTIGVVSVLLGLLQFAQGTESPLRFYAFTNPSEAVGFFANRNHFAALLFSLTLLAAAWALDASMNTDAGGKRQRFEAASIIPLAASFTVLVILVAAQTTARSRAGMGLTMVALFGAFLLSLPDRFRSAGGRGASRILVGAILVAAILGVQFSLYRVMERFAEDPLADLRVPFARNTITAAKAFMPSGAGMGTFVPVYASFEPASDAPPGTFANRAHNDVLELWLESGLIGPGLMIVFSLWLLIRGLAVWRHSPSSGRVIDHALPRAATLVIALLIAHSSVDYPLRTGALMGIFAFAAALLMPAPIGSGRAEEIIHQKSRTSTREQPKPENYVSPEPVPAMSLDASVAWPSAKVNQTLTGRPASDTRSGERWGKDVLWPEEWRTKKKPSTFTPDGLPPMTKPKNMP